MDARKQKEHPDNGQDTPEMSLMKKQRTSGQFQYSVAQLLPSAPLEEIFMYTISPYPDHLSLATLLLVCKHWKDVAHKTSLWLMAMRVRFPRIFYVQLRTLRQARADGQSDGSKSKAGAGLEKKANQFPGMLGVDDEVSDNSDSDEKDEEHDLLNMPPPEPNELQAIARKGCVRTAVANYAKQVVKYKNATKFVESVREKGNAKFKDGKLEEALRCYQTAFDPGENVVRGEEDVAAPNQYRIELRHMLAIVYSNCSAAWYRLKEYERAAKWGVRAHERLIGITRVMKDSSEFTKYFGELNRKIQRRIRQALAHVIPRINLVRHSDVPVEGVGVGTLLQSNRNMGGSIFDNSHVLLYQHQRGEGCQGVVLNKRATLPSGELGRAGGPVNPRHPVHLHNVADLPNATRVIDGVYYGGDVEEAKRRPGARVETFYGYATWFDGQLDGEIHNEDWTWTNNVPTELVFPVRGEGKVEDGVEEKVVEAGAPASASASGSSDQKDAPQQQEAEEDDDEISGSRVVVVSEADDSKNNGEENDGEDEKAI